MLAYQNLDGWKVCKDLVLASYRATDEILKEREGRGALREDDVLVQLNYCALRASGRIAFATGMGHGRLFRTGIFQALAYLTEFGSTLELVKVQGLLSPQTCASLDALRGRGVFYTERLIEGALEP